MPRATVEGLQPTDELLVLDPSSLDKTKHYRFVQERPGNLARLASKGYEFVSPKEHGVRLASESLLAELSVSNAEDRIRVGDTVLMMCDKSKFNERRKQKAQLAQARLSTEKVFQDQARRRGVKPLVDEEGE